MTDKTDKKVWFVTGAGRGMGVDFAMAALAAGYAVVATGRDTDAVAKAVGKSDDLLVVKLDVTNGVDAAAAARAAVTGSAASMCSSTMPPTSLPATSRS